jgi:hypothetical protein
VTTEHIKPDAITGKKRAMPKKQDDFKTTIMRGLELKKQELMKTLDSLMKARREISAYSQFNLIERKNKELQKIDYLLSRAAEEQDFGRSLIGADDSSPILITVALFQIRPSYDFPNSAYHVDRRGAVTISAFEPEPEHASEVFVPTSTI